MEFLFLVLLIVANGVFALSEMAVVSSRKARLQAIAEEGSDGAKAALKLIEQPNRFLSTVQIGITLIGIMAGAFGGAALSEPVSQWLQTTFDMTQRTAGTVSVALIVGLTTYLSLVIGELVPKRIALSNPEMIARRMAVPMTYLSRIAAPLVWVLSNSTLLITKLLGVKQNPDIQVSEMEVLAMVREGVESGTFAEDEQVMVEGVMRLDAIRIGSLITPRTEVTALDINDERDTLRTKISDKTFATYPVINGSMDKVLGVVRAKDVLVCLLNHKDIDLESIMIEPLFIPESLTVSHALEQFKRTGMHTAMVVGEYGGIEGLVRMHDILEQIVGELDEGELATHMPEAVKRDDGSWLLDGKISVDKLRTFYPDITIPENEDGHYETLAGFIMVRLGRVPVVGDKFIWDLVRFEVVDMDDTRIDRVMTSSVPVEHKATADSVKTPVIPIENAKLLENASNEDTNDRVKTQTLHELPAKQPAKQAEPATGTETETAGENSAETDTPEPSESTEPEEAEEKS